METASLSALTPSPGARKWLRAVSCPRDPSVQKARECLEEMGWRSQRVDGQALRATIEVLESDWPWAGVVHNEGRVRGRVFVTRGLVNRLGREELIAVLGHEWAHVTAPHAAPEWAVRCMALAATLGFHLLTFGLFFGEGGSGLLAWSASIALMTTLLIGGCLRWERRALRAQELACDRFAAQLVGPRTMVSTLRHVDGLMGGSGGQPGLIRALMGSSHPSTRSRVMNIARHRRMLGARP